MFPAPSTTKVDLKVTAPVTPKPPDCISILFLNTDWPVTPKPPTKLPEPCTPRVEVKLTAPVTPNPPEKLPEP